MNLLKRKSESPFRFQPPCAAVMGSSLLSEVGGGSGWSVLDLVTIFGVHVQTIYLIKSGKRRAEIVPSPRQTQGEGVAA